jgi:hypothetical protein
MVCFDALVPLVPYGGYQVSVRTFVPKPCQASSCIREEKGNGWANGFLSDGWFLLRERPLHRP